MKASKKRNLAAAAAVLSAAFLIGLAGYSVWGSIAAGNNKHTGHLDTLYAKALDALPDRSQSCRVADAGLQLCLDGPDSFRIDFLNVKARAYEQSSDDTGAMNQYFASALAADSALQRARSDGERDAYGSRAMEAYSAMGIIAARHGDYSHAIAYVDKATEALEQVKTQPDGIVNLYQAMLQNNKGYYQHKYGNDRDAAASEAAALRYVLQADTQDVSVRTLRTNILNNQVMICQATHKGRSCAQCSERLTAALRDAATPGDSSAIRLSYAKSMVAEEPDTALRYATIALRGAQQNRNLRGELEARELLAELYRDGQPQAEVRQWRALDSIRSALQLQEVDRQLQGVNADVRQAEQAQLTEQLQRTEKRKHLVVLSLAALAIAILLGYGYLLTAIRPSSKWRKRFAFLTMIFFVESVLAIAHFFFEKFLPHNDYQPVFLIALLGLLAVVIHPLHERFNHSLEHLPDPKPTTH